MFSLYGFIENSVRVPRARVPAAAETRERRPRSGFRFTDTAGQYFQYPLFDIISTTRLTHINYLNSYSKSMSIQAVESALWSFRPPAPSREK